MSPSCETLISGLAGAYQFKRIQVSGADRFHDKPDKTPHSHICEALHYALLGAGEGSFQSGSAWQQQNEQVMRDGGWRPNPAYFE